MFCKKCGEEKTETRFATFKSRRGEVRRRGVCWDCRLQYQNANFERLQEYRRGYNKRNASKRKGDAAERRAIARAFTDAAKDVPCKDCGKRWPPVAMDFDHIGPKSRPIANMVSQGYRLDLIKAEIAQCEVVCACCHRIRTARRNDNVTDGQTRTHILLCGERE